MTTFEKIGIQGIRSYCDEQVEKINFSSPITIIYGNNGSGKSTIIECLKVSCTGDFPPNAEKGKSFLHDPLISNKMNVKGKIDLMIRSYNNKRIGISRSFNLFYSKDKNKRVKHTFRALDNSIIIKKDKGDDIIITNKCVDINNHIPKLMGVSKALLENVILCHHDESLWPFSESTKIKKKFDELFGDDHFSKVLDELIKCKKQINEILKKKEFELLAIKDCYIKKKDINLEVERNEKEIENAEICIQLDQEEIKENFTILDNLNKKNNILNTLASNIDTYSILYDKFKLDLEQYQNMKEIYEENSEELLKFQQLFKKDLYNCQNLIEKTKEEIIDMEKETKNCLKAYDESDIKENDIINKNVDLLNQQKNKLLDVLKCFFDLEHDFFNNSKEKEVNAYVLKEYLHLINLIENNEICFKQYIKMNNILSKKNYNFKFNERNSSINKIRNHNSNSLYKNVLSEIKKIEKMHVKKSKIIRYFTKRNFIYYRKNLLKKKDILKKNKLYKERILKIDKKIEHIEKYKNKLNILKIKEEFYNKNVKKLESISQLKDFYDTISFDEIDNYNLKNEKNQYEEQILKYNYQINEITNIKKILDKFFFIISNCNLFYKQFLSIKEIHKKIFDFMKEQIDFFYKITNCDKFYNLIKKKEHLYLYIEDILLYRDSLYLMFEKKEENQIFNGKGKEQEIDTINYVQSNKKKESKTNCELDYIINNDFLKDKMKNVNKLEKNIHIVHEEEHEKTEEEKKIAKKRENVFVHEAEGQSKKRKIISYFSNFNKNNLEIIRNIIDELIEKYENKITKIKNNIYILKEKMVYISKELDDFKNKMDFYSNCLSEFNIMLKKNKFKNVKDFVLFFCSIKKDLKKIKLDLHKLYQKEESMNNFLESTKKSGVCDLCRSDVDEVQIDKVQLNIDSIKNEINQKIEEKKIYLSNLKSKKKEIIYLLKYHLLNIEPIDRKTKSIYEGVNERKKRIMEMQSDINKYLTKINRINEKYKLMKQFQSTCLHLINREKNIFYEKYQLLVQYKEIIKINHTLQDLGYNNMHAELDSLIGFLEQIYVEKIHLRELKEFLNNFKIYNHKEIISFIFDKISACINEKNYIPNESNNLINSEDKVSIFKNNYEEGDHENALKHILIENVNEKEKNYKTDKEIKEEIDNYINKQTKSNINKELREEKYVNYERDIKKETKQYTFDKYIKKEKTDYYYANGENKKCSNEVLHNNASCEDKEEMINLFNFFPDLIFEKERILKLHNNNTTVNDCEKNFDKEYIFLLNNYNFFRNIETLIDDNEKFKEIYNKFISHLNLEEFKKKETINMINKMKSVVNNRNEYITEKTKELESIIKRDKKIRDLVKKLEKYISYYLKKKKYIEVHLSQNSALLGKCEMREKCIRKRIINNKNSTYNLNRNYYVKMNIMNEFVEELERIDANIKEKEISLNKVKEKIYNNEAIKSEVDKIAKKISQKKEQILCLEKEKINIEKMHHSIIMNTNLKKLHERFLDHHKKLISSITELKDSIFMDEQKGKELNEINSIIKELEQNYEISSDIYNFINKTFDFTKYKKKLNELINVKKENLKEQIESYTKTINILKIKEAELKGKIDLRKEYIEKLKKDIKSKMFTDIEREYKRKMVEIYVYKNVVKDICNFYFSFDQAIIKFHSLKMQEINISIKNLWRRVYTSADIDYIYIKSDVQTEFNDKLNQRRSYNYRVVMVKDNCELDMKGRCSSGQKVLSSIIIRLALAESFSIKCGILALDEPTTNLDKSNSRNLASLIANIVDLRKNNSTFQLILITHDTYFVDVLSQYGLTNCFYKIKKDEQGYSKIEKTQA